MAWEKIGEGTFNTVYRSGDLVFKVPKRKGACDDPERAVRLWNLFNSHIKPPAEVYVDETLGRGWTCPFIKGKQASDAEISTALIAIFNASGRIVLDAFCHKNFVKTAGGAIVCLDIGLALQLENRGFIVAPPGRRKSDVSLSTWSSIESDYKVFWEEHHARHPLIINMIRALIFIKTYRKDLVDVSFLDSKLAETLAEGYMDAKKLGSAMTALSTKLKTLAPKPPVAVTYTAGMAAGGAGAAAGAGAFEETKVMEIAKTAGGAKATARTGVPRASAVLAGSGVRLVKVGGIGGGLSLFSGPGKSPVEEPAGYISKIIVTG
jgi:hypothetical protein